MEIASAEELAELSWEERVDLYGNVIHRHFMKQLEAQNFPPHVQMRESLSVTQWVEEGMELLLMEGEQSQAVSLGFLNGYVVGRCV